METILLLATTPKEAYQAVSYICEDIKENHEADHKLYFARIMFGGFHISLGESEEIDLGNGVTQKNSKLTGEHELVIFPAKYEEQLEKLKTNKTILMVKNCMCIAGPSEKKQHFRKEVISWLLDNDSKWNYANVDLTEG